MKKLWALVLAGCLAAVLSTAAWADETPTAWDGSDLTLTSGSYYLSNNVTISDTLTIEGTVTLDLNGWVLQRVNASENGSVIHVKSGTLTLKDKNTEGKSHNFKVEDSGLWVLDANGDKTVEGGVITGGTGGTYDYKNSTNRDCGGGVYVAPGARFVMEGGNIVGCRAVSDGGGVFVADAIQNITQKGAFEMSGGTISGCAANNTCGGGVYNNGETKLSGTAVIQSCRTSGNGGGVYSERSLTISGDVAITGCTANEGGAMYVKSGEDSTPSSIAGGTFDGGVKFYDTGHGKITVSGGTFNGSVNLDGGNVTVSGGTFNGDVSGNAHVVTFDAQNGSDVVKQVRYNSDAPLVEPKAPTKDEFDFGGWYTDKECTEANKYNFSKEVTESFTLYAKWTEKQEEPVVGPKYYYYSPADSSADAAKASPKTFDAGVGVYVGMAVLSLAGMACVGKKRH